MALQYKHLTNQETRWHHASLCAKQKKTLCTVSVVGIRRCSYYEIIYLLLVDLFSLLKFNGVNFRHQIEFVLTYV